MPVGLSNRVSGVTLRFTNTALLALLVILTITGVYGLIWTRNGWLFEVHRAAGWALIALLPWKALIALASLRRGLSPRFDRSIGIAVALILAAAALVVLALGVLWALRLGPDEIWLRRSVISWHWLIALGLLPLLLIHVVRRWPRPKATDFASRRATLKLIGLGALGLAGWGATQFTQRATPDMERFTGSREHGSFSGNDFPVTHGDGEGLVQLNPQSWRLALEGAVESARTLTYAQVLALPATELTATLDCTLGWYSTQVWRGVRLSELLTSAGLHPLARAVRLKAMSGYAHTFLIDEIGEILLATHVGAEPLDHAHGFPLRAVVPSRRGWFWIKWLTGVEVLADPREANTSFRSLLALAGRRREMTT
jgi:DMSO/TMAO reductase YedYZ molybdopterin-dependent catalytic subunit